ncbi:MAG: hypothetical protein MUF51_00480 [Vicinamibacteria bacterium]|nr:hypothetical protein [Vicinamibacteria bacterium]
MAAPIAAEEFVTVTSAQAVIRSEPNARAARLAVVARGTRLILETRQGEWIQVRYAPSGGMAVLGYVAARTVKASGAAPVAGWIHTPIACLAPKSFPSLSACLATTRDVARAYARFRAADAPHLYSIEMSKERDCFSVRLPKPKKTTSRVEYSFAAERQDGSRIESGIYTASVVVPPEACATGAPPPASALVVIVPRGAPKKAPGFEGDQVVAVTQGSTAQTAW